MKNTGIEWTDHTVNFWWGCTKVSPACANCYAESVAKVFGRRIFGAVPQWGAGKPRAERLEKARLEALALNRQAEKKGTRFRVFVNSMSDWLDDEVPIEWLAYLLETITLCSNIDFQLLTKRPENWPERVVRAISVIRNKCDGPSPQKEEATVCWSVLHDWLQNKTPPPNVWIGTTVENQEQAEKRIPHLLEIPANVRFLSCEPLLGSVDISHIRQGDNQWFPLQHLHWVIAGGESGGKARPMHPDWARSLRYQCAAAGVPFFFKQWGEWAPCPIGDGPDLVTDAVYHKGPGHDGAVWRIGKDKAGRLLDGVEHSAFPA